MGTDHEIDLFARQQPIFRTLSTPFPKIPVDNLQQGFYNLGGELHKATNRTSQTNGHFQLIMVQTSPIHFMASIAFEELGATSRQKLVFHCPKPWIAKFGTPSVSDDASGSVDPLPSSALCWEGQGVVTVVGVVVSVLIDEWCSIETLILQLTHYLLVPL